MKSREFHAIACTLSALLVGVGCRDYSNAALVAGPPAAIVIFGGSAQQGIAGTDLPAQLIVHVIDARALPIKGQLVSFRVTSGGGSALSGAAVTNDLGEARDQWKLGTTVTDPQLLEARAVNSAGETIVAVTFTAQALPGPATQLIKVAGDLQSGAANTALSTAPVVRVADKYGNSVSGALVTFAASGGGSVTPPTQTTATNGLASTSWVLGPSLGTNTMTATASGATAVSFSATVSSLIRRHE